MSKCPSCNTEMKALFTREYCPNDCDLPGKYTQTSGCPKCKSTNIAEFKMFGQVDSHHCWDCGAVFKRGAQKAHGEFIKGDDYDIFSSDGSHPTTIDLGDAFQIAYDFPIVNNYGALVTNLEGCTTYKVRVVRLHSPTISGRGKGHCS